MGRVNTLGPAVRANWDDDRESMRSPNFRAYVMAVDRVEKLLKRVTSALDAAGIKYAVIGGNAVAAWVARVDPGATRATKDVDLLVEQSELARIAQVMQGLGFMRDEILGVTLFVDPQEPSVRCGVYLVWADRLVRPGYVCPAPSVDEAERDSQGFLVLDLPALVRMKLTSYRRIDQVHIEDLLRVGLMDESVKSGLPAELRQRLAEIEQSLDE